jgi:hypothetical protein
MQPSRPNRNGHPISTAFRLRSWSEVIVADDPGEGIRINKAKVIKADIATDNGVIHLINRVLLP